MYTYMYMYMYMYIHIYIYLTVNFFGASVCSSQVLQKYSSTQGSFLKKPWGGDRKAHLPQNPNPTNPLEIPLVRGG